MINICDAPGTQIYVCCTPPSFAASCAVYHQSSLLQQLVIRIHVRQHLHLFGFLCYMYMYYQLEQVLLPAFYQLPYCSYE